MLSGIGIVSAETVTGELGASGYNSTTWENGPLQYYGWPGSHTPQPFQYITYPNFELSGGTAAIIRWETSNYGNWFDTYDAGAPAGASTPVIVRISNSTFLKTDGRVVATGSVGYQRYYNSAVPPVEQFGGYKYLQTNLDWDIGNETGTQYLLMEYNHAALYNTTIRMYGSTGPPTGFTEFGYGLGSSGLYLQNKLTDAYATYSATKPSGIGISGTVTKEYLGTPYNSRIFITNSTGYVITSEAVANSNQFNFTTTADQIYICMYSSSLQWHNSTLLFAPGSGFPTPTPTVTQTPSPYSTIPAGYIRSMFQAVDGVTSGQIHNATINIKDETAGTWFNGSYLGMGSYYGTWYIDTLPGHTLSGYGSADGYTSTSLLNVPADGNKMYELIMQPGSVAPAPTGKVKLFVLVNDFDSGAAVSNAKVTVSMFQESTVIGYTNTAGTATFDVKNVTGFTATAEKNGYYAVTRSGTTTASGPDTIRIELRKPTVTPVVTRTPVAGEVTARPTLDMRTASEKDNDIMDLIRNNGESLVSLAILMTMIFLVGGIGGRK